ncbi:MAG: hypothetical protein ACRD40_18525 [Candidatus Acidiferrales bacterium]
MSRIWQALRQAEQERKGLAPQEAPDIGEIEREPAAEKAEARPAGGLDRRKVLRNSRETAVLVYGSDSEKQPFHEQSDTIDANENGCLLSLASSVSPGQRLFLTNMQNQAEQECRVVYVGPLVRGKSRVGVEFTRPSAQFWQNA